MLALNLLRDQPRLLQAAQVDAGSGGTDGSDYSQFGTGAGMVIHQREEHPGARWFANRGGDS
jgi:hypothetical protein